MKHFRRCFGKKVSSMVVMICILTLVISVLWKGNIAYSATIRKEPVQTPYFKPVSSEEEIPIRLNELKELFDGYRWGALDSKGVKKVDDLVQAVKDGYTNMDMPYTMEERRNALGLIKVDGHKKIYSNRFNASQCAGFAKFICFVLFGQELNCGDDTSKVNDSNGYKVYKGDALDGFQFKPGDYIREYSPHSAVVEAVLEDGTVLVIEGNVNNPKYGGDPYTVYDSKGNKKTKYKDSCWINWGKNTYRYGDTKYKSSDELLKKIKAAGGYVMRYVLPETTNGDNGKYTSNNLGGVKYATIPDGDYSIITTQGLAFDVENWGSESESNLQIYEDTGNDNQVFTFIRQPDGSYIISPKHAPNLAIDVSWGEIQNGQNIWLYEINGTEAQKFFLIDNKDGTYMFVSSKNTGYVLDVEGQKDGTLNANIHLWEKHGDHNQCFRIVKAEKKAPISINMTSVLDSIKLNTPVGLRGSISSGSLVRFVYGAIIDLEGNVVQETVDCPNCKSVSIRPLNLNQQLLFDKLEEGYYTLYVYASDDISSETYTKSFKVGNPEARCTGYSSIEDGYYRIRTTGNKVLDVVNSGSVNETNVQIYSDYGMDSQIFEFKRQADGSYTISPKNAPGMTLDVSGGYAQNGGNIQIYEKNGTMAQEFFLFKNADGTYVIASGKNINCVLDIQDRRESYNNANVQVWDKHNDSNQRFYIENEWL